MNSFAKNWKNFLKEEEFDTSDMEVKDTLHPKFWFRGRLDVNVRRKLMKIAEDIIAELNLEGKIKDITITGSIASYNWHNLSDIDLHIMLDFADVDQNDELVGKYLNSQKTLWNKNHTIIINGHEVEIYFQDIKEEHKSLGLYSIKTGEWLEEPSRDDVELDLITAEKKASALNDEVEKIQDLFAEKEYKLVYSLCEKFKKEAVKTNFTAIQLLLDYRSKNQKIIFPTSNSGYGVGEKNKFCDENSPLNPISLYGKTKSDAEKLVLKDGNCIAFRLATIFGFSYRMRTDLLVNNFVERAIRYKKIEIYEPMFRRNFIHIRDVISAFIFAIENFSKLKNNVYNIGLSSANITKIQLVKKIKKHVKNLKITINKNVRDPDQRDYFVSNKKIEKKGFKARINLDDGIEELVPILKNSTYKFKNNY